MKEPERLFDLLDRRRELAPERPVFANKKNGKWEEHKIEEYIEKSTLCGADFSRTARMELCGYGCADDGSGVAADISYNQ